MERDFLGVIGKETGSLVKDDGRGRRQDSGFYGGVGSTIQWPFSGKPTVLPPFMSIKTVREEKSRELAFDQFSLSGFQPKPTPTDNILLESNQKTSPLIAPQYAVHGYGTSTQNMNRGRVFPVVSHHNIPFTTNSPFFKVNNNSPNPQIITVSPLKQFGGISMNSPVVGSTVGLFAPREMQKPPPGTAQLTIFYAGSVNVFDNVPLDKAQEIMMLASKSSSVTSPPIETWGSDSAVKKPESNPLNANQVPNHKQNIQNMVNASPQVSVASQSGTVSRSASSSCNTDSAATKSVSPLGPTSQPDPAKSSSITGLDAISAAAIMPRAVPQARKASLARFLEKRKERVSSAAPYSCDKKPLENGDVLESSNLTRESPSTGFNLSRNCTEESFSLGQTNNSSYNKELPSTKLKM